MIIAEDPQMEESIYQILPPAAPEVASLPRHRSKYSGTMPPTSSTFGTKGTAISGVKNMAGAVDEQQFSNHEYKKAHATFGMQPGSHQPDPQSILGAGSKMPKVQNLRNVRKNNPEKLRLKEAAPPSRMPVVPRHTERPIMNLVSSKNFVTANAVENILAAPKQGGPEVKDYLNKADYGRVPRYLERVKKDINEEFEYIQRLQDEEEEERNSQVRQLSEEEKEALIEGLKAKWEKVNTDYQATTHITKLDTHGKIQRKEQYEATLTQIERDIEKLNKRFIMVDTTC